MKSTLTLFFLIFSTLAFGNVPLLTPSKEPINLGKKIGFFRDDTGLMGISEIIKQDFHTGNAPIINQGLYKGAIWGRFTCNVRKGNPTYLVFNNANLDSIDVWTEQAGLLIPLYKSGNGFPVASRTIPSTSFLFGIPDQVHQQTIYFRVKTQNTFVLPVKLMETKTLHSWLAKKYILGAIYIGAILSLLLYNLFLFISLRDRTYLYYVSYLVFLGCYSILYLNGFSHLINNGVKDFMNRFAFSAAGLGFISALAFAASFLRIKDRNPTGYKVLNAMNVIWGIIVVINAIGYKVTAIRMTEIMAFITPIVLLYYSIIIYRSGFAPAKYFILSWIFIISCIIYFVLAVWEVVEFHDFTFNIIPAGSVIELILLSFALGDRMTVLRKEKNALKFAHMQLIESQKQQLEEKVRFRTADLETTMAELRESNAVKDKFFSILAHDLRSPLINLRSTIEYSENGLLNDQEIKSFLGKIKLSVDNMYDSINGLLSWSAVQIKQVSNNPEIFNVESVLMKICSMYDKIAERKGIAVVIECEDNLHCRADLQQFSLVIRNLVDNAIKFTLEQGTVIVKASAEQGVLKMEVIDGGEGISEEMKQHILNTDGYKALEGTAKEMGFGLGLQLTKEFLSSMDSELCIENSSAGTIFCFEIPLKVTVPEIDSL